MSVSACVVTRGDVDLSPVLESLLLAGIEETIVWDNSRTDQDLAVYGRYAAIDHARGDLIYVQDDDCVLPPSSIEEIVWQSDSGSAEYGRLVCNMPANFRHAFYERHALVGFGACFHRDAPERAFARLHEYGSPLGDFFHRTCDIVFTSLTPYAMVDVPYENLPWADAPNRMWKLPKHVEERQRMLDLVKQVPSG